MAVASDVLARLRAGYLGPVDLLAWEGEPGILATARAAKPVAINRLAEDAAVYATGGSAEEAHLVTQY